MDNFIIAFMVLLGSSFLSRYLNEKATKKLDQEKKAQLIDLFSKGRILSFGILIGIIVLYFISLKYSLIDPLLTYLLYILAVLIFLMISSYLSYKKLKQHDFPDFYIKSYLLTTTLRFLGMIVFFIVLR